MKKNLILFILLLVIIAGGWYLMSKQKGQKFFDDKKVFTSKYIDLSFNYPKEWGTPQETLEDISCEQNTEYCKNTNKGSSYTLGFSNSPVAMCSFSRNFTSWQTSIHPCYFSELSIDNYYESIPKSNYAYKGNILTDSQKIYLNNKIGLSWVELIYGLGEISVRNRTILNINDPIFKGLEVYLSYKWTEGDNYPKDAENLFEDFKKNTLDSNIEKDVKQYKEFLSTISF